MSVVFWDILKGIPVHKIPDYAGQVNCITLSRDGGRMCTGSSDKSIKIWKISY